MSLLDDSLRTYPVDRANGYLGSGCGWRSGQGVGCTRFSVGEMESGDGSGDGPVGFDYHNSGVTFGDGTGLNCGDGSMDGSGDGSGNGFGRGLDNGSGEG
jgi:hypothetical protein